MTKKNGFVCDQQRYKCLNCGKQFTLRCVVDKQQIWKDYVEGKQTYKQLSQIYSISSKSIQRHIKSIGIVIPLKTGRVVVVIMDTTYFGRTLGVMLFKDAYTGENLLKYYVKYETNIKYFEGIEELKLIGFTIVAIVCDGRKGLLNLYPNTPTQMCQFHQQQIITRYLTKNPRTEAGIELKRLTSFLCRTDKDSFIRELGKWYLNWEKHLMERSINPKTGKSYYTHKKLRSAYRSLKSNLPWLFVCDDNIELKIPNTTNKLEGHFSDLKNKLRNHNGLSMLNKKKFIDEFLKA